jgi:hypothetical protein
VKVDIGPVRLARLVGISVKKNANGSIDMKVRWEYAEDMNYTGMVHIHEREVGMILAAMGKRIIH